MHCCDHTISDVNENRQKQRGITNEENMSSKVAVSLNSFSLLRLLDFYVLSPFLRLTSITKYSLMLILKGSYLNSLVSYAKPQLAIQKVIIKGMDMVVGESKSDKQKANLSMSNKKLFLNLALEQNKRATEQ